MSVKIILTMILLLMFPIKCQKTKKAINKNLNQKSLKAFVGWQELLRKGKCSVGKLCTCGLLQNENR